MQLDVMTLFPQWFDWFTEQRHVGNALAAGNELRALDLREHTPLSGGQVDDTPFGGGAGMVLRVDVVDHALRGFYGVDPVDLRRERRVIALTPGGRILDEALVNELAAEPAVTLLCGRYEGFDERIVAALLQRRGVDRPLRAGRRRARGDGRLRRRAAQAARARSGTRTRPPRSRSARRSAATPSTRTTRARRSTAGWSGPGRAAVRPPRGDPPLAPRAQPRARSRLRRADRSPARLRYPQRSRGEPSRPRPLGRGLLHSPVPARLPSP